MKLNEYGPWTKILTKRLIRLDPWPSELPAYTTKFKAWLPGHVKLQDERFIIEYYQHGEWIKDETP